MRLPVLLFLLFEVSYCNPVIQIPDLTKNGSNGDQFGLDYGLLQRYFKNILPSEDDGPETQSQQTSAYPQISQSLENPICNDKSQIVPSTETLFPYLRNLNDQDSSDDNVYQGNSTDVIDDDDDDDDEDDDDQECLTTQDIVRQLCILQNQQQQLLQKNVDVKSLLEINIQRQLTLQQQLLQELRQCKQTKEQEQQTQQADPKPDECKSDDDSKESDESDETDKKPSTPQCSPDTAPAVQAKNGTSVDPEPKGPQQGDDPNPAGQSVDLKQSSAEKPDEEKTDNPDPEEESKQSVTVERKHIIFNFNI